jgi:GH15 family glucan-1,4-alpha-glucosidase
VSDFTSLERYGLIGNLETCALVGSDGSVDWFPFPHIESPSMFAAVLDPDRGGRFRLDPTGSFDSVQQYVERTNVLETTFRTATGTATITDFMPPAGETDHPKKVLYRRVECTEGSVTLELEFEPRFDYDRAETTFESTEKGVRAAGEEERAVLESPVPLDISGGHATGSVALDADKTAWFLLRCTGAEDADTDPQAALNQTVEYWRDWAHACPDDSACVFGGPWHGLAVRSGLVLKLMTHVETGAVAAAPTTSLPEEIGGVRNWDYRFSWARDAAFTLQALANLGHTEEARSYFEWFLGLCQVENPADIQPLYGLHGESDPTEQEIEEFSGYRNSQPVRIGNDAAGQRQLDTYGELVLAAYDTLRGDDHLSADDWASLREIIEYVCEVWDETDAGIWEVRGDARHFVHSKVMCWAALDRGLAIADEGDFEAPIEEWRQTREEIRQTVIERGFDEDLNSFVQSFDGTDTLDATGLLIPMVGFLPFDDPRVQGTIDAIDDRLATDDGLVHRYDGDDGLPGEEGAFVLCSFWLIDALVLSGRVDEARERFENALEYVSPLGLLAEEVDAKTGTQLGNFPQAFSHIGLINSALYLGRAEGKEQPDIEPMGIESANSDAVTTD